MRTLMQIAEDARRSKYAVAKLGTNDKNRGILAIADTLMAHADEIIAANRIDIENGRAAGLNDGLIDRLMLDEKRIAGIAEGCRQVAALPDPVGEVLWMHKRPNGLNIGQKRVPMGVIGIIYEARPNVTVDAAVLCFKAGSACILRGGKEAFQSSMCLTKLMRAGTGGRGSAGERHQSGGRHQPRHRNPDDEAERLSGCAHPARRCGPDPLGCHERDCARHRDRHGQLPRLR